MDEYSKKKWKAVLKNKDRLKLTKVTKKLATSITLEENCLVISDNNEYTFTVELVVRSNLTEAKYYKANTGPYICRDWMYIAYPICGGIWAYITFPAIYREDIDRAMEEFENIFNDRSKVIEYCSNKEFMYSLTNKEDKNDDWEP